jgi:hypothetical protein
LLSESTDNEKCGYVESGLKKVFSNSDGKVSYKQVESVGLGYIKDVNEAQRVALQTARRLCESFGFEDNEKNEEFVKEMELGETGTSNSEENREVQIAKEILAVIDSPGMDRVMETEKGKLQKLAQELLDMHSTGGAVVKPGTGGKALYKRGSVY